MLCEVFVAFEEMSVAHEASVCAEWAGVCALEDKVARMVNERCFFACRCSPEHEDKVVPTTIEGGNGSIGECFPSLSAMAEGLVLFDREACVEQKDALFCPACQVATLWNGCSCFGLYLFENVLERGREGNAVVDTEAESVRLSRSVIRVLPEDDDTNIVEGRCVEGIEDEPSGRIAGARGVFLTNELRQVLKVGLAEFFGKLLLPGRFNLDHGIDIKTEEDKKCGISYPLFICFLT